MFETAQDCLFFVQKYSLQAKRGVQIIMNELTLKLKNISVSFGNKDIFDIENLSAYMNDRIAITGNNGAGKSTLLKIIAGEFKDFTGEVQRETEFNYLSQIGETDESTGDYMDYEMLSRMNVPENENLSGGEETKLRLVQTLSDYKTGLLLDEPTTHLDHESIEYLIKELEYYYGTLIFVSHDRYFINSLATKIWEVSEGTVTEYTGNYNDYEAIKNQEKLELAREHENVLKEKDRLNAAINKQKAKAEKMMSGTKGKGQDIKPDRLSSSKQKDTVQKQAFKTAKAMESRMEQLHEIKLPDSRSELEFPQSETMELHNKFPVMGQNVTVQRGNRILLDNVSFQFPLGQTIAVTGKNGAGKSSFLADLVIEAEGFDISPKVTIEQYRQMDYKLYGDESTVQFLMRHTELQEPVVRSMLVSLGFSPHEVMKPVNKLSGGEATRVSMALLFVKPSNIIILDEPTNFIDLGTIEALEKFIKAYHGTIILTSHDRYFVERTADLIYKIEDKKLQQIK